MKLRGIGNLSRYPPYPPLFLPSFLSSFSFAVRDGGKKAAPRALQKEVGERCDRSDAGYYKTKGDGLMPIIKEEGSSVRRGWAREKGDEWSDEKKSDIDEGSGREGCGSTHRD